MLKCYLWTDRCGNQGASVYEEIGHAKTLVETFGPYPILKECLEVVLSKYPSAKVVG